MISELEQTSQLDTADVIQDECEAFKKALIAFGVKMAPASPEEFVDGVEAHLCQHPKRFVPRVKHEFTPGIYVRTAEAPAGSMVVTEIHNTEHPFVIHTGSVSVWTEQNGMNTLHAPYLGVTKPGTRRIFFTHTDVVWTTFHATNKTDPEEIHKDIIMPHVNSKMERSLP